MVLAIICSFPGSPKVLSLTKSLSKKRMRLCWVVYFHQHLLLHVAMKKWLVRKFDPTKPSVNIDSKQKKKAGPVQLNFGLLWGLIFSSVPKSGMRHTVKRKSNMFSFVRVSRRKEYQMFYDTTFHSSIGIHEFDNSMSIVNISDDFPNGE